MIQQPGHSLLLWAAREAEAPAVRLVCHDAAHLIRAGDGEVVVAWRGCLAKMPRAVPFELLELGVPLVVLDASCCRGEWAQPIAEIAHFVGLGERLWVQMKPDEELRPAKKVLDADAMPVVRRRSIVGLGAVNQDTARQLPDETGSAAERLRSVVRRLLAEVEEPGVAPEDGWGSGAYDLVSEGCTACRVCALACPTEALAVHSASGRGGLGYDPSLCTGCGICLQCCGPKALSQQGRFGPPALLAEAKLLELFEVKSCPRCRLDFRGAGEYCAVCAFRVANPFGHTMPPGWHPRP